MRNAVLAAVLLVVGARFASAQAAPKRTTTPRIPVYISHVGEDGAGAQFVAAVERTLSRSEKYRLGVPGTDEHGFQLYVDLLTLDADSKNVGASSVASVVIEEWGLPNSWPVLYMWYHKVFPVEGSRADETARQFLADMDAHWCNHIKSSVGNCPRETLNPVHR